jgi:hypothetical protein
MRFIEFKLTESTLQRTSSTSWPGYLKNLLTAKDIGIGPQGEKLSGQHLDSNSKDLIKSLINLRDTGNSVIVVEHDKEMIEQADYVLDIGPKAGIHGGKVVVTAILSGGQQHGILVLQFIFYRLQSSFDMHGVKEGVIVIPGETSGIVELQTLTANPPPKVRGGVTDPPHTVY